MLQVLCRALGKAAFLFTVILAVQTVLPIPLAHAQSTSYEGFVHLAAHDVYVDYLAPQPGKPTIVLLNGLTYRFGNWDAFVGQLKASGAGVLRYDMWDQGQTLLKYAPATTPVTLQSQVDDLVQLLSTMNIDQPVHVLGLSYGGAVGIMYAAQQPDHIASLILMSPFVAPIPSQDQWIRYQVAQNRILYPLNPATDDELYDYFLHVLVVTTYPSAEPIVLENPYKLEATYRLAEGVHSFNASDYVDQLPANKTYLLVAREDQYVPADQHEAFWQSVPESARASRLFIENCEHKIPEAMPNFSASWVTLILNGDARLKTGATFEGKPFDASATTNGLTISGLGNGFGG